jgi:hypothetical protein
VVFKDAKIREYRMQLAFLECVYVLLFVCFLVSLWRKRRESVQTRAGKLIQVAMEFPLCLYGFAVKAFLHISLRILKYHFWEAFLCDTLKSVSISVCTSSLHMKNFCLYLADGILEHVLIPVCVGFILFWFYVKMFGCNVLNTTVHQFIKLLAGTLYVVKILFYYAPDFVTLR